jgi:hypothetical protein
LVEASHSGIHALLQISYPIIGQVLIKQNRGLVFLGNGGALPAPRKAVEKLMKTVKKAGHRPIDGDYRRVDLPQIFFGTKRFMHSSPSYA